jgi:hypothetical protein
MDMFRLTVMTLILVLFLPALMPLVLPVDMPAVLPSPWGPSEAWAQVNSTALMQQSDHKRRAANKTKPEPVQQQAAGVVPIEAGTGNGDYVILAILVISGMVLAFVAARKRKIRSRSRTR